MTRMMPCPCQIPDQQCHARAGSQFGAVTLRPGSLQQCIAHLFELRGAEFGLGARRTFAGQHLQSARLSRLLPAIGHLPGHQQTSRHFGRSDALFKQSGSFLNVVLLELPDRYLADLPENQRTMFFLRLSEQAGDYQLDYPHGWLHWYSDVGESHGTLMLSTQRLADLP